MTIWKTEGPTDLLALLSVNPDADAFTTASGAQEKPLDWIIELCRDKTVHVVHDADKPGQDGATYVGDRDGRKRPGWVPRLAEVAAEVKNVVLPFEIQETHGSDLRDFFGTGYEFADLVELAEKSPAFQPERSPSVAFIDESEDDPQRLARINLERYRSEHDGSLIYWRDEWWKWKEGRYRRIDVSELRAKIWAAVRAEFEVCWTSGTKDKPVQKVTRSVVGNVIGAMESICSIPSSIQLGMWMPDRSEPNYIAAKNGILDLQAVFAGKSINECLIDHSPSWFSSFRLDYAVDLDAECPQWLEYLDYCMEGDQERIDILQEWSGYLLTTNNDFQKFLVLEGEGGNGKTVYFAAMMAMLGADNVSHVTIENFGGRFELGTTVGKMANISGDAGEINLVAEGVLKQFTGGDVMQFDRKNLPPISAKPTAKLMVAWNSRPRMRDKSDGVWRRMILVPFQRTIEPARRVLGMDTMKWWLDQGEAPGILLWAIEGLHRLRTNREFTESEVCKSVLSDYRIESNPVSEFLDDFIQPGEGAIESQKLYELYSHWCKKNGLHALGSRQFGKEIRRKFNFLDRIRVRDGNKLTWKYEGIIFSVDEICAQKVFESNLF